MTHTVGRINFGLKPSKKEFAEIMAQYEASFGLSVRDQTLLSEGFKAGYAAAREDAAKVIRSRAITQCATYNMACKDGEAIILAMPIKEIS